MPEEAWYEEQENLIDELRGQHRSEAPLPEVEGYTELCFLRSGGQGRVYLAKECHGGRQVALKVFHAAPFDGPSARRRYEREIELVARLGHPNVVRLFRFGRSAQGQSFLSMEFIDGQPWAEYAETCKPDEILALGLQIADALGHAHRRGVIHRDLKPGNVIVDRAGNARLIDFGMAKPTRRIREKDGWELSATGQFLGTLRWASPEQLRGHQDEVDTRTDIYALGLLLYQALCGRMPYEVMGSVADLARNVEHKAPTPIRRQGKRCAGFSADLETVLLCCLAKQPSRRYASMAELSRDLAHVRAGEPIEARRDGPLYVLRSLVRAYPFSSAALGCCVLALVLLSIITTKFYLDAQEAQVVSSRALAQKRAEAHKVAAVNEFLLGSFLGQGVPPEELADLSLQEVLSTAAGQIETRPDLADQPAVRADLHVAYAYWFAALPERLERAREHAKLALALYARESSPSPLQTAWALEVLAGVDMQQAQFDGARTSLERALELYREAQADELNLARVLGQLASCGFAQSDLAGVLVQLSECREILVRKFGEQHAQVQGVDEALEHARRMLGEG